jgi:aminoglycoside 3-N-acetyltransferase
MSQKRTREDARRTLIDTIRGVGVDVGDTVFVGIDMGKIPLPYIEASLSRDAIEKRNKALCAFVFETIKEVVGERGTIIVPTYSNTCARPGSVYVHERTPSEVGPFTEYVRRLDGSKRSVHPIFSVCAIGARANEITEHCGGAAFGACSPFARLSPCGAKFLCLGVPFHRSVTYVHHLEQSYGCNHRYNKVLTTRVVVDGVDVQGRFMAYLRFRGVKADANLVRMEQLLLEQGALHQVMIDGATFQSVLVADVDALGYAALKRESTFFLSRDVVIHLDDSQVCDLLLDSPEVRLNLDVTSK